MLLNNGKGKGSYNLLLRRRVAHEAAFLLYTMQEMEFKQAKERAASALGLRVIPTNLEVAEELDRIADEYEGERRKIRLVQMRKEALKIMEHLKAFYPRLIGSVWRGTANKNSDIDIVLFAPDKSTVVEALVNGGFNISRIETTPTARDGGGEATHIFLELPSGDKAEIIVRRTEDMHIIERCDIYGDLKKGLTISQLKEVLEKDPLKKFIPKKA
ncbi:MAG: nucleotidyltransferase domain-containing protein [Candidatus Bathyarchaeota archaeon]|nr:nucleotidyltransferase domain-containing protein [Candidatus Bathyarchaeota archaeon]